ncbi:MAG: GNAT family N-acetyltransferase [Fimbriimonas sp.]
MEPITLCETGFDLIAEYAAIPIGFEIRSRLKLPDFVEVPEGVRWKDYDMHLEERPSSLARRFDVTAWGVHLARQRDIAVGGCIVAWNSADFDMLEGRCDVAVIVDLRVRRELRGRGVGRRLLDCAREWAIQRGCVEMRVETQDTNVAACRFYRSLGFELLSVDAAGYGDGSDEAKVIFTRTL